MLSFPNAYARTENFAQLSVTRSLPTKRTNNTFEKLLEVASASAVFGLWEGSEGLIRGGKM